MILRRRDRDSLTLWGVFPVFYMSLTHAAFAYFHTSSLLRFGSFIVHVKQFTRKCHLTFFMAKLLQQIIAADLENFRNRMISRVHDYSIRLKHCEECMKLSTTTKALHCHIFSQLEVNYLLTSLARSIHFHNKATYQDIKPLLCGPCTVPVFIFELWRYGYNRRNIYQRLQRSYRKTIFFPLKI